MSGSSENGNGNAAGGAGGERRQVVSPGRVLGARSASPAKRTAADMEGIDETTVTVSPGGAAPPGSFTREQDDVSADFDEAMRGMTPVNDTQPQTQDTGDSSMATSAQQSVTTKSSATSFQSDAPPPYSAADPSPLKIKSMADYSTSDINKQEAQVLSKQQKQMEEGQQGVVVSTKWLQRVLSRSTDGLKNNDYPKEAREGPIGQVDNSDILPDDALTEPILHDIENKPFIPIKLGLSMGQDFEVLNNDAWGIVVAAYGLKTGQKQIIRYVRNTAGEEASGTNLQYEIYPPIFTIRKVPQPKQDDEEERPKSASSAVTALRVKQEQRTRGQMSPDDAAKLVSSRQEKFQKFLARSKEAVGIPRASKVRIFKMLDPANVTQPNGSNAAATSRSPVLVSDGKLVVSAADFEKMEIGKDLDYLEARDETNNSNYNGTSTMELYVLTQAATLLLDEQIGGPGGGEYASDKKKIGKINLAVAAAKKGTASKPSSAPTSGRTSPAPGSGIMTRGRTRRDGRTRGTVGLNNLGNTCYMNSALQCIRSAEELTVYFLSSKYKEDINADNPLGHKGAMAKQYATLLNGMYAESGTSVVSPSQFKKTLGNFAPMFSGYGQQDSQEFLSFLVDALHEDLNRILKKPYNENPDSTDETVKDPQKIIELGDIYRKNHRARNDSVAMDLFSGFYKNTMECPKCDKISITFDPYSLLTVQLPNEGSFQHPVTFVPLHGTPVNHTIDCDKGWTIKMVKENVASKHPGVEVDKLWMVEVYSHKLYKVFENSTALGDASIQSNDHLFIFELDAVPTNTPSPREKKELYTTSFTMYNSKSDDKVPEMDDPKADCFAVPVFSRQKSRGGYSWEFIMHPVYITVTREEAQDYETILKKALIAISRMTSRPILTEMDDAASSGSSSSPDDVTERGTEESAQVTDTSGSEDGYVNVSVGAAAAGSTKPNGVAAANGTAAADKPRIPADFMDPEYFIPRGLRSQLFMMNYAGGQDNSLHCTGMSSIQNVVKVMHDRVKKPSRRGSTQSVSSDDSTTSTGSGTLPNGEVDDSEGGESMDMPDLVLGNEDNSMVQSDEELPDNPLLGMPRKGRRKNGKKGKDKKGKRKQATYGKHNARGQHNRFTSGGSNGANRSNNHPDDDENPYYIKLGEGIVLDWYPEALDGLFAGDPNDSEDPRGQFLSSSDGKNLPYVHDPEIEAKRTRRELRKKHGITLDECFLETGKREVLSEDNAWYCNSCKELRRATKTLEIWTCPDILVVHLKRFGGNRSFRDKIDTLVEYPVEGLDMTDRVGLKEEGKSYIYDLFAVDCHFGGLGGGHYTAMARSFVDGGWYDYNDSMTSRMTSEARLQSASAYLLFYRRRSDKPLGPQYLQDLVLDARNQTAGGNDPTEDGAEGSDSGEGRLGGPNGYSRGPSSVLQTAAGAAGSRLSGAGSGAGLGAGAGVGGSRLMSPTEMVKRVEGRVVFGPEKPLGLMNRGEGMYGSHGTTGDWNFDGLDEGYSGEVDAENLIVSVEERQGEGDDGDADSTTAQLDHDQDDSPFDDRFEDAPSGVEWAEQTRERDVLDDDPMFDDYQDDHRLYSGERGGSDSGRLEALHLEDAGMIGGEIEDAPLDPSPPTPPESGDEEPH